ncbi:MAG: hypothetical protein ACPGWR_06005 [Ardenticatenaceae bacterium]
MSTTNRSIFRSDAVQRYIEARQKAILPRFVRPRVFAFMWLLLGLLLMSGVTAWVAQVPIYAPGVALAVVVDDRVPSSENERENEHENEHEDENQDQVAVVAFLPPEQLTHLHRGQTLFLQLTEQERVSRSIVAVEPEIMSPAAAQKAFALTDGAAMLIRQPSAVVQVPLEPLPNDWAASVYAGSVYQVEVEVGSRRLVSLLPVVGEFFGE